MVLLPRIALLSCGTGAKPVMAAADGIAREQILRTGRQRAQFAKILDGLKEGGVVVTHPNPNDQLASGYAIANHSKPRQRL